MHSSNMTSTIIPIVHELFSSGHNFAQWVRSRSHNILARYEPILHDTLRAELLPHRSPISSFLDPTSSKDGYKILEKRSEGEKVRAAV